MIPLPSYYDEDHWYGWAGWPSLRAKVRSVIDSHAEAFLVDLAAAQLDRDNVVASFLEMIIQDIGRTASQSDHARSSGQRGEPCPSSAWSFALALFAEPESLRSALVKDADTLTGKGKRGVRALQALHETFRQFLDQARRAQSPSSEHRMKTWEAIDRVSRDLARRHIGTPAEQRNSNEHLLVVSAELRVKYPTNKNVNVSLGTLRGYFDEFATDHERVSSDEEAQELRVLEDELGGWPAVDPCVDTLKSKEPGLWEALAVETEIFEGGQKETRQHFMARIGLSRQAFERRWKAAAELLRECVDASNEFQLRRRS